MTLENFIPFRSLNNENENQFRKKMYHTRLQVGMLKKAFLLQNSSKALLLTYFLHFSQLYMLSPFNSSAEKNAAKQWCSVIVGPQNHLKEKHMPNK